MGVIKFVQRKSMKIRPSGRSSDFITPSFGFGSISDLIDKVKEILIKEQII